MRGVDDVQLRVYRSPYVASMSRPAPLNTGSALATRPSALRAPGARRPDRVAREVTPSAGGRGGAKPPRDWRRRRVLETGAAHGRVRTLRAMRRLAAGFQRSCVRAIMTL
ncbi:hypothetical protein predicted by Glimmer/Critica [Sorangium cellulosum So ce56]|uniref:Uncharacterized protein n=1 Tax=Sorangium cellulosum (strain So ce56) TaxID=448385 RepID=A9GFQ2_SORC5|nr:hypothetical protein predicted by Glimmer/Critica [Sorangium cellulosum So ce56]